MSEKRTKTRAPAKAAPRPVRVEASPRVREAGKVEAERPANVTVTKPKVDVKASVISLLRGAEKRCRTGGHLDLSDLRALRKQVEEL